MYGCRASVLDLSPIYGGVDPYTALQESVLLAQKAEEWGYSRYWVSEHHDMPQLASSTPEVLLAHIGAKTRSIRIGSGAVLLPNYRPYKVAEAFGLLATLYPGRVDLGIGRAPGGSAHASLALCGNFLEQVGKMNELVEDLSALLLQEFTVEGQPVVARPVPPVPAQLWLLGTNQKSAQFAAEHGAGYVFGHFMSEQDGGEIVSLYRERFQPSGHHREPNVIVAVGVICAETDEEAQRLASRRERPLGSTIVGGPKRVQRELAEVADKCRANELMIVTDLPDYEKRLRSYEWLARSVFSLDASM